MKRLLFRCLCRSPNTGPGHIPQLSNPTERISMGASSTKVSASALHNRRQRVYVDKDPQDGLVEEEGHSIDSYVVQSSPEITEGDSSSVYALERMSTSTDIEILNKMKFCQSINQIDQLLCALDTQTRKTSHPRKRLSEEMKRDIESIEEILEGIEAF
ncbi:hypothetical protein PROFUN_10577 [Planoprotostelium fungivorum]|uniref:Uncharacterized protein n=1 Tax=Planoprotostelium fungivorum TaxID=1890364 RepID=A0A2P6ND02_9EUKA|nr:hypothetical protein PROFUN_10577 [Planoprotostelium fungivorum]